MKEKSLKLVEEKLLRRDREGNRSAGDHPEPHLNTQRRMGLTGATSALQGIRSMCHGLKKRHQEQQKSSFMAFGLIWNHTNSFFCYEERNLAQQQKLNFYFKQGQKE